MKEILTILVVAAIFLGLGYVVVKDLGRAIDVEFKMQDTLKNHYLGKE